MAMQQRLTLVTLGVEDLERSTHFYRDVFGWTPNDGGDGSIVFFQLNGIQLALYGREPLADDAHVKSEGTGFRGVTLAHNVRSEQEVDEIFADFESKGVNVVKSPEKVFWGGYSGYIADPDGHLWEIACNPFMKYDDAGNVIP